MEVCDAVADLAEHAVDLRSEHLGGHDDGEEVVGSVFHDLKGQVSKGNDMYGEKQPRSNGRCRIRCRRSR